MAGLVTGVVLAAEDSRPLAGAEVSLCGWPRSDAEVAAYRRPLRWNDPPAQVTGPDGRFAFAFATAPLPPLGWDLFVRAPQRATGHRRWRQLDADRAEAACEIKMAREFSVRAGTVTERGEPAANACVELSTEVAPSKPGGRNVHVRAVSDAGGNLDFAALPVGEHTAITSNAGAWRIVGWTKLVVASDGSVQGGRIVVTALDAKIEGRVVDDTGSAQAGVEVIATTVDLRLGGHLGKATTGAEGRFMVWRHRDAEPGAALRLMLADETALAPAPSWNAPARDYVAPRRGSVQLRVVDAAGEPVQRFAVEWLGGNKPARVGSIGGHHSRGETDLGACAAGMTFLDVLPGGQDLGRAGIVGIDVAPASAQIEVVLSAGAILRGRLVPADIGRQLAQRSRAGANEEAAMQMMRGAMDQVAVFARPVLLGAADDGRRAELRATLRDGEFVLRGLAPGAWDLVLRGGWFLSASTSPPFARIEIADGSARDEVFDVHHLVPGSLSGRVLIDGAPASAMKVRLAGKDWYSAPTTTDAAGNVRFEAVLPGRRWLHAEKHGFDPDPIVIASGVNAEHTFHLRGMPVTVRLRLDDGTFVRSGLFQLCLEPDGLPVASGRQQGDDVVFDRVAPGRYSVRTVAFPGQQELHGTLDVPAGVPSVECEVTLRVVEPSSPR